MNLFKSLSARLIVPLVIGMSVGFLLLIQLLINLHEDQLSNQHDKHAENVLDSINIGLRSVMVGGYADIAQDYAADLHDISGVTDISILRVDGTEAFLDNKTIDDVNERKGGIEFFPRDDERTNIILPADSPLLSQAATYLQTGKMITANRSGDREVTFISPIKNGEECYDCHGSQDDLRGLLKLTLSLKDLDDSLQSARTLATGVVVLVSAALLLSLTFFINRLVAKPLQQVKQAMARVSTGDFDQKVPDFGAAELHSMATIFNQMSEDLKSTYQGLEDEHNKINTLIQTSLEGMIVTDKNGKIVLVNPAAVKILKKSAAEIKKDGFLALLGDVETMRQALSASHLDKNREIQIEFQDRTLLIKASTIRNADGQTTGSAALIRDISESASLKKKLEWLSTNDALTGIYNRRFIDQQLPEELNRARRYQSKLSVFLFDIDYFKNFNDAWGHDQGDRVLQSVAKVLKDTLRTSDFACRYGGEEFLAILPNTDEEGAHAIAERLRLRIAETSVDGLNVTVSIGVASDCEEIHSETELISRADESMYLAKGNGRNRVINYSQIRSFKGQEGMV